MFPIIEDHDLLQMSLDWTTWRRLEKIEHPDVVYDTIHNLPKVMAERADSDKYLFIATYSGDCGLHEDWRLGPGSIGHKISLADNIYHIFTTNCNISCPKITPLPYGIGDIRHCYTHTDVKDILCYARFTVQNAPGVRRPCRDFCDRSSFITCDFLSNHHEHPMKYQNEETLKRYFTSVNRSKFVISPYGNGPDTYRTWETLYCGAIPICLNTQIYRNFVNDLPILLVDKWEDINESLLLDKYDEMINKEWNWDLLKLSYWHKRFEDKFKELQNEKALSP